MNGPEQNRELWREALGSDAERVWNSFDIDGAPPLRQSLVTRPGVNYWRWAAAAALLLVVTSAVWNVTLMRQLNAARSDFLIATLHSGSSNTRLYALHSLRTLRFTADATNALRTTVVKSEDPNVQLAALDILLDQGLVSSEADIQRLLQDVRHNRRFLEIAVRARSVRT